MVLQKGDRRMTVTFSPAISGARAIALSEIGIRVAVILRPYCSDSAAGFYLPCCRAFCRA
jgi:hypothetical protein